MGTGKKAYRIGVYEKALPQKLSWEEKFIASREAGFDFMEMSVDESDEKLARLDWSDQEIEAVLKAEAKTGFPIESITFSAQRRYPMGTLKWRKEAWEIIEKCVAFAKKMGIRIIMTQGYDVYYEETSDEITRERFYQTLEKAVMLAAAHGVTLATETMMDQEFMNSVEKVMYGVNRINSPYYQAYPDIGNIYNSTDDIIRDIRTGAGHMVGAHLKETLPGKDRSIPYGQGQVDFPTYIAEFYRQGIRRYVAEFWHDGGDNWKQVMKENRDFLDRQFDLAFKMIET
ncbi:MULTISPECIES: L-ribulose-5-phosphate 3-epimerase [Clostridium]|uniref:L-ribulose-5-phosphate 3-epimerase n=1 Tax=Clostridium porci TaxID=2605778 RepID=A0A7X2NIH6_9CLOT|nr:MULTISPECIES: L-ribulose-5-phosphate 3-epimerase [Clostridium]MCI6139625.1 L-ribulose-5-phosphate 3-epimerase [Clostridium sp.]MSS35376.1 L-ribulose-5-phosphate 3-epimerase [Clostridium porci]